MPISSFHGIQTSLRGLLAHQRALDTAGHNVTNANTEGYSRQDVALGASAALTVSGATQSGGRAQLGTGVDAVAYRRMRDTFLDLQFRAQNMVQGEAETEARVLGQAEIAFAEPSDSGLASVLGKFWSAWGDLANAPESTAARQAVVDQGTIVAAAFARLDQNLAAVSTDASAEYTALTAAGGDVDSMAREIAALNQSIKQVIAGGGQPNDLMDRRDLLLDKLSALAKTSVTNLANGAVAVTFGDAATALVNDATVTWPQAMTQAAGGRLGALVEITRVGGTIAGYRADLASAAQAMADAVNTLHNPGGTGIDFFSYASAATAASTLAVVPTSATVRTGTAASPGANDIAIAIGALRGGTGDQRYQQLVGRVGTDVKEARRAETNARTLTGSIDDRRQSASGVSLDEEMAGLVRFQRGYQASARAMSAMDEMLDTLIRRTGRVGL